MSEEFYIEIIPFQLNDYTLDQFKENGNESWTIDKSLKKIKYTQSAFMKMGINKLKPLLIGNINPQHPYSITFTAQVGLEIIQSETIMMKPFISPNDDAFSFAATSIEQRTTRSESYFGDHLSEIEYKNTENKSTIETSFDDVKLVFNVSNPIGYAEVHGFVSDVFLTHDQNGEQYTVKIIRKNAHFVDKNLKKMMTKLKNKLPDIELNVEGISSRLENGTFCDLILDMLNVERVSDFICAFSKYICEHEFDTDALFDDLHSANTDQSNIFCEFSEYKKVVQRMSTLFQRSKLFTETELNNLKLMLENKHENVHQPISVSESLDYYYVIYNYLKNKRAHFYRASTFTIKNHFEQIVKGLRYFHDNNIDHGMVNLETLMVEVNDEAKYDAEMTIKIADFGYYTSKESFSNSRYYFAPEKLCDDEQCVYDKAVDIWSLGIILHYMFFARPPFTSCNEILCKPMNYDQTKWEAIYPDFKSAKDLLEKLLNKDPNQRPNIDQILKHPFFTRRHESSLLCESLTYWNQPISILFPWIGPATQKALADKNCKYKTIGEIASASKKDISNYIRANKNMFGIDEKKKREWLFVYNDITKALNKIEQLYV